jgi:hypothetical protein
MAISSLSKITVPLASDASNSTQGLLMPKLQYRFRVSLENFGVSAGEVTELTKQVQDVTRPNVSFETMTIDVYNSRVYLAGKHTWEAITLTLRDDATGAVQKLVGEQLQRQFDFMEQSSAASGIDYKFVTRIEILDGGNGNFQPEALETFELYGCYLESANYNQLAYSANEPATVALTVKYDNAIQTQGAGGGGIGTAIGRSVAGVAAATGVG